MLNQLTSFGLYPEMEENKKIAIQIANFDGVASLITFLFYFFETYNTKLFSLALFHFNAFFLVLLGIFLIHKRYYNSGRILIHFVGLAGIFLSIDGVNSNSSYEFYYFTAIIVPFVTFTSEEIHLSIFLALSAFFTFGIQYFIGTGLFSTVVTISPAEKVMSIAILFAYIIGLFSISRWQNNRAQEKIKAQKNALTSIYNVAALGVMSGGIAHEINNPLQILIARIAMIKKQLPLMDKSLTVEEHLSAMEKTIERITKIVKGLKSLSRNTTEDAQDIFALSEPMEDVMVICRQKLIDYGIVLEIKGDTTLKTKGSEVQFSQVLINLFNNAVDALEHLEEKWITLEVTKLENNLIIYFTDSGCGISAEIEDKIMHPFFTTKEPGKGTGLGLSISKSIIEKAGGKFYYDNSSQQTRFVIEMPVAENT